MNATVAFATGEEAVAVFGRGGEELRTFADAFSLSASQRDLCVTLSGGADAVARAKDCLESLIAAHRTGFPLSAFSMTDFLGLPAPALAPPLRVALAMFLRLLADLPLKDYLMAKQRCVI